MSASRLWGVAVSAALLAAALGIVAMGPEAPPASALEDIYHIAQAAPAVAAPVGFIVRFRGDGPIARAQALAARGQMARAQRQVEVQLARQSAFRGLCFDRFTVGGAEIVLLSCAEVPASARAAFQTGWLARLNAMRAVDYADANAAVSPERAPG
jgi:hypothetical protein